MSLMGGERKLATRPQPDIQLRTNDRRSIRPASNQKLTCCPDAERRRSVNSRSRPQTQKWTIGFAPKDRTNHFAIKTARAGHVARFRPTLERLPYPKIVHTGKSTRLGFLEHLPTKKIRAQIVGREHRPEISCRLRRRQ